MKVLHVTKKYPHALGGDAVVVANLQKQQTAAGHVATIVTSNCSEIEDDRHIYKVGLRDTPRGLDNITIRRIVSLVVLFFQMFTILHKERPDIIHTHSVDMAFFVSFAAKWYHIPIVHTFHIVTFYDETQPRLRRKSELWLAKKTGSYRVTAPNTFDVKKLQAAGLGQTVLLPNGVDLTIWKPRGYTEKNRKATFVAVGRLEDQKGYRYLIKAAALLAKTSPLEIIIVGIGSQKKALKELAQNLGVQHHITFAGQKSPHEILSLLTKAHAAVFPSLYETTPLTLLETWAAGTPAIATPVGILRDVPVNFKAAHIVPAKDHHALASAMQRLIKDRKLREATARAGHAEAKKYAWPVVAQSLEIIYRGAR
jgi:glycosyltransferase involved in cell wall biosynthesis